MCPYSGVAVMSGSDLAGHLRSCVPSLLAYWLCFLSNNVISQSLGKTIISHSLFQNPHLFSSAELLANLESVVVDFSGL